MPADASRDAYDLCNTPRPEMNCSSELPDDDEDVVSLGLKKIPRAFSLCKGPSLNLFRRPKPL